MLTNLTRAVVRRRVAVLVAALALLLVAGPVGGSVIPHLTSGGFADPAAESSRAAGALHDLFDAGQPNLELLVSARGGSVDDPQVAAAGAALTRRLAAEPGVTSVVSYWTAGRPPSLRGRDGRQALVVARISGGDDQVRQRVTQLSPRYTSQTALLGVGVGGSAEIFRQLGTQTENDLRKAETIAIPITLLLLVLAFGSAVAGALPLAIGGLSIVGTLLVLRVLNAITPVSIFALNLTTALSLGLAIDYSLLIVSRFREELRGGLGTGEAVVATVRTAGRTVLFSALTVAASLAAALTFPLPFLRSFGYAGIAVVALAAAGAIVVLPALLAVLGPRVDRFAIRRVRPPGGGWHRLAVLVMRRPLPIAAGVIALLVVLGLPFLRVQFGLSDDRVLPAGASSHQVAEDLRRNFATRESGTAQVVAPDVADPRAQQAVVGRYAAALSSVPGVARVDALSGSYAGGSLVAAPQPASARFAGPRGGTWLDVVPSVEPVSPAGERLVRAVRGLPAPFAVQVAGPSAQLVDTKATLLAHLPLGAAVIALVTFVVLFLMTGSVVVPAKALVLNLLSLSASFGAMVWIFQDGHLAHLLGFTSTGTIETTTPILMFILAFGLSMDYEVFLLARIKEEHDRTGDTVAAVASGLERTGRIVTTAAALLAVVFLAFATSGITFLKMMGLGTALAIVVDATLVRALLVPAFMRLAGRANWWAPAPLRALYRRFGLSEAPGAGGRSAERPVGVGGAR